MADYKALCMRYLDRKGIKYTERDERSLRISYNGDNMKTIAIIVVFDKDGEGKVAFKNWDIGNFKDDSKYAKALMLCNEMNKKWRWVKFYVDKDYDITAESDALVCEENVGAVVYEIVQRSVNIIDESYPEFMKIRWA